MAPGSRRSILRAAVFLLAANGLVHAMQGHTTALARTPRPKTGGGNTSGLVHYGLSGLPEPVVEMREAILAAARSGRIEDLRTAIELNEIKPVFPHAALGDPIAHLKAASEDGEGRDVLAAVEAILEAGWIAVPLGRDLENNRVYLWPHFAETGVEELSTDRKMELARLVPPAEMAAMAQSRRYTWWRLGIGADGVWHFLTR